MGWEVGREGEGAVMAAALSAAAAAVAFSAADSAELESSCHCWSCIM